MDWRFILSLSSLGAATGVASVLGWIAGVEGILWVAVAIFCAFRIAAKAPQNPVFHGAVVGLIAGLTASLVKFLFLPQYLANNPDGAIAQLPVAAKATFFLATAHYTGIAGAAVVSLLTWLALRTKRTRIRPR